MGEVPPFGPALLHPPSSVALDALRESDNRFRTLAECEIRALVSSIGPSIP